MANSTWASCARTEVAKGGREGPGAAGRVASAGQPPAPGPGPEIHRVGPRIWVDFKALMEIFSQTAGSACELWANPVNFTVR
jgi:hypothetical protein